MFIAALFTTAEKWEWLKHALASELSACSLPWVTSELSSWSPGSCGAVSCLWPPLGLPVCATELQGQELLHAERRAAAEQTSEPVSAFYILVEAHLKSRCPELSLLAFDKQLASWGQSPWPLSALGVSVFSGYPQSCDWSQAVLRASALGVQWASDIGA